MRYAGSSAGVGVIGEAAPLLGVPRKWQGCCMQYLCLETLHPQGERPPLKPVERGLLVCPDGHVIDGPDVERDSVVLCPCEELLGFKS